MHLLSDLLSDHESNEFPVTVNLFLMSFYTSIKMCCHVMNAHVCCMSHHQSCDLASIVIG